ncbi:MAG: glycosyltransferase family 4 protein [Ignavibacteria bacterium]|nr:glycosyltransferase family 4 protein [Ignavibacteria bacterium]
MRKEKISIAYVGRFPESEIPSGPEKTAYLIFREHISNNKGIFIQYFYDGRKHGLLKKLFGKEKNGGVITCGILRIYSVLKNFRPEIIHIITFDRFALICFIYRLFNKTKIVYTAHGAVHHENSLKSLSFFYRLKDKFAEKFFVEKSDRLISVSGDLIDMLSLNYKIDDNRCAVTANPVDVCFSSEVKKNFNHPLKAVAIFRNDFQKEGFEFLTRYIKSYKPQIDFFFIVSDWFKNKCSGFDIRTFPLMKAAELAEFYKDKHLFFSLNKYDTFSISTAEAMSAGLIPVLTESTGISRYIKNGYNGYTVKFGEVGELSVKVNELLSMNHEYLQKISSNASLIYNDLSSEAVYRCYMNIYLETLS